eukprot:8903600-Alexandrium_andersonii.AAC.1
MAVRPSRGLFEAAVDFAQRATFSPEDGWSGQHARSNSGRGDTLCSRLSQALVPTTHRRNE